MKKGRVAVRDPESGWIRLYPNEFFLLWTRLGLGEPPSVLGIRHVGRTAAARRWHAEAADAELSARDLGTMDHPARDLVQLLKILGESELRLDLHLAGERGEIRSFSAAGRQGAATAEVIGGEVRVGPVREPMLVATMLDALKPLPAAPGGPANVRVEDFHDACAEGERDGQAGFLGRLEDSGVRGGEAGILLRLLTKRIGGGQLGAGVRGRSGRWSRAGSVVNWVDTDEGRYALRTRGGWLTATPVDPLRLRVWAQDMVGELVGQ
ncbi:ESX secretion-associated protein EspG [Amycolatopsis magusensis]|uniref:ESX secretion-associated protein EspG n=1 Tax=Amycolatopsis magusensis TaxID=882444 RepID=UPI003C30041B